MSIPKYSHTTKWQIADHGHVLVVRGIDDHGKCVGKVQVHIDGEDIAPLEEVFGSSSQSFIESEACKLVDMVIAERYK